MRTFVEYIKNYFKEGFNWKTHAIVGIFLAVTLGVNYLWDYGPQDSIYNEIVHVNYKSEESILYLFLFYSLPFLFTSFVLAYVGKEKVFLSKKYLLFGLFGIALISLDSSYYLMQYANEFFSDNAWIYAWQHQSFSNLSSLFSVIIPLYVLYIFSKDFKPEFYGFKLNGAKVGPYLWLILFMIPLIYLASFRPDFLEQYPTYHDCQEYKHLPLEQWQTAGIYELCYGFDFISVELFFRGFMVVGLSKIAGRSVILPMIAVYCFLHFGKPAGEAISSIFGGYILGILAFKSRNIFGGLIAHLGVAWGMEYLAFLRS